MAKEMREVKYAGQQFRIKGDFDQVLCRRRDKSTITQWCGKPRKEKVLPKFMFLPEKDMSMWDGKFDSLLTREDVADYLKVAYLSPEVDIFIADNIVDEKQEEIKDLRERVKDLEKRTNRMVGTFTDLKIAEVRFHIVDFIGMFAIFALLVWNWLH